MHLRHVLGLFSVGYFEYLGGIYLDGWLGSLTKMLNGYHLYISTAINRVYTRVEFDVATYK